MSLVFCTPAGSLIGGKGWLPTEPFDYAWGRFGCNRLKCGACGQWVKQHVPSTDPDARHYECACQQYDAYGYHLIGSDEGHVNAFVTEWVCAGHPEFQLPAKLDGVGIDGDAALPSIVQRALRHPPFIAPDIRNPSFWVQRLYRLLQTDAAQGIIGNAVADALGSSDAVTVRAAIDFFVQIPDAPGGERLPLIAQQARSRFESIADPNSPNTNLYERLLEAVEERLSLGNGRTPDPNAVSIARQSLLDGSASSGVLFRIAAHDREWFCNHAADIVRVAPARPDFVFEALKDVARHDRVRVLRNLRRIDGSTNDAVLQFAATLGEPDRSFTLKELSADRA